MPNLASLHNRILLLLGEQPSTIRSMSSHVRGYTFSEVKRLLSYNGYFSIEKSVGVGLIPIYSDLLPSCVASLSHTIICFCEKSTPPVDILNWAGQMQKSGVSSNYFRNE